MHNPGPLRRHFFRRSIVSPSFPRAFTSPSPVTRQFLFSHLFMSATLNEHARTVNRFAARAATTPRELKGGNVLVVRWKVFPTTFPSHFFFKIMRRAEIYAMSVGFTPETRSLFWLSLLFLVVDAFLYFEGFFFVVVWLLLRFSSL